MYYSFIPYKILFTGVREWNVSTIGEYDLRIRELSIFYQVVGQSQETYLRRCC